MQKEATTKSTKPGELDLILPFVMNITGPKLHLLEI